ncbi:hypothetical protein D9C73_028367 [Collichthys lucidus]|uniref:Uncharacterized protein n=1 Tax=Collichthys lucidus TaxID=240159 RepID=A0A4U5TVZ5_COLLU|nr:hypothetical protein D9C73_028367 [Collichthys lucidus]
MWMFVMMFCLLDHNQALPWEHSSLQLLLQQVDQTGPQQLRERQQLENMVEHMDSLESSELLPLPVNSLWINQLGERADERDASEDGERRHQTLLLNFDLKPGPTEGGAITEIGGVDGEVGVVTGHDGGYEGGEEAGLTRLVDDSAERDDGMTVDSPGNANHYHSYHGNEEGLELGL